MDIETVSTTVVALVALIWAVIGMASFVYWFNQDDIFILREDWTALIVSGLLGPITYFVMMLIYARPAYSGPFRYRLIRARKK